MRSSVTREELGSGAAAPPHPEETAGVAGASLSDGPWTPPSGGGSFWGDGSLGVTAQTDGPATQQMSMDKCKSALVKLIEEEKLMI